MLESLLVQKSVSFASILILYNSDSYNLKSSDQIMEQRLFSSRVPIFSFKECTTHRFRIEMGICRISMAQAQKIKGLNLGGDN